MTMPGLLKYLMGVAAVLSVVIAISVVNITKVFVDVSTFAPTPAKEFPRWTSERLKGGVEGQYAGRGSLSPIYPAAPAKELLEGPTYAVNAKQTKIRQATRLRKLSPQTYPENQDLNYPLHSLSYTETLRFPPLWSKPQLHTRIISGRELY